jgi:hypothetical protein
MNMRPHVVRHCDFFSGLAVKMGFNADAVWMHESNRKLRETRSNRELLAPGDIVYVPTDEASPGLPLATGTSNRFKAVVPQFPVQLLVRSDHGPIANEPYIVEGASDDRERVTGKDGLVSFDVSPNVHEVRLVFPRVHVYYTLHVGGLDPVETRAGQCARLSQLGYLSPTSTPGMHPAHNVDDDTLARAIAEFQRAHGLEVNGCPDAGTLSALASEHGI